MSSYSTTIAQKILITPVLKGANQLYILSQSATSSMASWLLTSLKEKKITGVSIKLIITFANQDSPIILESNHNGFKTLQKQFFRRSPNKFSCSYYCGNKKFKSNFYIWFKDNIPIQAFSSSYDFTQDSMMKNHQGLVINTSLKTAYNLFLKAEADSIYCNHSEVEEDIVVAPFKIPKSKETQTDTKRLVTLPLIVKKTGETGNKSGLNWGQRKGRNPNEAYIPLPRKIAQSGFFPLNKQHFLTITDDHHTLLLRVEQQGDKAITTPASNAQLGEYFRNRLGLGYGQHVYRKDLDNYGRLDVAFYKIDDEQYYMDFSINKK